MKKYNCSFSKYNHLFFCTKLIRTCDYQYLINLNFYIKELFVKQKYMNDSNHSDVLKCESNRLNREVQIENLRFPLLLTEVHKLLF